MLNLLALSQSVGKVEVKGAIFLFKTESLSRALCFEEHLVGTSLDVEKVEALYLVIDDNKR